MSKPEVTLIDYTGAGSNDPLYAAKLLVYTKSTRLEQGEDTRLKIFSMDEDELMGEIGYIANTIRSSWEFVDYTFQVRNVTRAFTHQFVRTRTASYAQQAQRVVKLTDIKVTVPETVSENRFAYDIWQTHQEQMVKTYQELIHQGIPAQDARAMLMTAVQTNIIMKANLRTMADMVAKRENLRAQGEYQEVARQMRELIERVHPWTKTFLEPVRTRTPALDAILREAMGNESPVDQPRVNAALKELDTLKGTWG